MLIFDDSKGTSDGKEKDQLQAMVAVGSEFITYRDAESTVQKSGEFVRIEKESSDSQPRFVLLHETSQTYTESSPGVLQDLTGNELLSLPPATKLRKRSRLYMSETDPVNGDLPFREIGGFKTSTRISRFHYISVYSGVQEIPRSYYGLAEANYTAQAGKRRLFSKGDGKLLMVREVAIPGDSRYFTDYMRSLRTSPQPHVKNRGLRAARVEVVEVNPTVGTVSAPIFSFDVHSGVGFDPTAKFFSDLPRSDTDMYSETTVFAAFSGVNYGSSLYVPTIGSVPAGGDASDTYAVAEPAIAKYPDGREYTSIIAVYPAPDDVYDSRSSGAYRLTCKRTTAGGGVALSKINFPAIPHLPKHYLASRGMSLHRLGPGKVVLRVNVHAMQFGAGGTIQAINSDAFFMWTQNNGETWTYAPVTSGFPGVFPYGGMLVKDKNTLLAFSWFNDASQSNTMQVHSITASGTAQIAVIPASTFNAGLLTPGTSQLLVPYVPVGFGGAVYRADPQDKKKKKRLWMQFDPYWIYRETLPQGLQYPSSRPMLLVSDDGGATWSRRFLPTPWSFRAGFVVAISEKTLAVPVLAPRKARGSPVIASIFLSEDGGDTWKKTNFTITLPGETWADGQIVVGEQYWFPPRNEFRQEQDVSDSALRYNRGELLPMVALRDADGKLLPANPARPWMNNHNIKEPEYG